MAATRTTSFRGALRAVIAAARNAAACAVSATLLAAPAALAQAPDSFAARIQLDTQRCGPFCRVALPPEIHRYSASADLSDLRVVDAQGRVQPYARHAAARADVRASEQERALAVYPVRAAARATVAPGTRLRMDRAADGAIRFQLDAVNAAGPAKSQAPARPQDPVVAYVIDARALETPAAGLRLDATFPAGRLVPLMVERSRDLTSWEPLVSEPVYRLDGAAATLERSSVRFRSPLSLRDSFVRITWPADVAFELRQALALSETATPPARVAVELNQVAADARTVEWELPASTGWEALELRPAGRNALLPLTLQARRTVSDPWINVGRGVVYRIGGTDGGVESRAESRVESRVESISPPVAVTPGPYRRLRAVIDENAPPLEAPPKARLLYRAEEIVFLAQGTAPFALVAGHAKPAAAGAALPLPALLPDYRPGAEAKVPPAVLGGVEIDAARAAPARTWGGYDVRTIALWVVLAAAVLLLSLFAYSLLRKLRG